MTWVRLDDNFAEDPRFEAAGPLALALYVAALCYANRNLTDGALPLARAHRLIALDDSGAVIESLIENDLWTSDGQSVQIVDFHDWQPARVDVQRKRADAAERQRKHRMRRANGTYASPSQRDKGVTNAVSNTCPDPTRPQGRVGEGTGSNSAGAPIDLSPQLPPPNGETVTIKMRLPTWSPGA